MIKDHVKFSNNCDVTKSQNALEPQINIFWQNQTIIREYFNSSILNILG